MSSPIIKDHQWVRRSFLVTSDRLSAVDKQNRFFSTAAFKFTDTTPGGNFAINPPPQFTRNADVKADRFFQTGKGMGRYYSEAIDDNSQLINIRFGVPKFNSLTSFFTGFYNTDAGRLARTGRSGGFFYTMGRVAGFVCIIHAWPLWLGLAAANLAKSAYTFLSGKPQSKFYYLKPTMALYWNAVTTIVNHLATNKGIVPRALGPGENGDSGPIANNQLGIGLTADQRKAYHQLLPDIFDESGSIDIYALANKAQRLARKHRKKQEAAMENSNGSFASLRDTIKSVFSGTLADDKKPSMAAYMKRWTDSELGKVDESSQDATEKIPDYKEGDPEPDKDGFWNFMSANLDDGSEFATFRVNYTGTVNESFTNTVQDSEIAQTINGLSSQSRSTNFTFANGNISDVLGGIVQGAKDFAAGAAESFGASGLVALAGSAFVDIPKHWQSSAASLPRSTYTINLVSPYGNPLSRFINIDIPLAMLLAGALPLSTGKQSYTSPFICELYDQGRNQIRLGMIDSLSVTRGGGNLGFTRDGQLMNVEVSFSVVDMSSIMHMPIAEGFSLSLEKAFFDEDTVFTDYMATLAGMDLQSQIYALKKLKVNLTRQMEHWNSFFSVSHYANFISDTTPARLVSALWKGTDR